MRQLKLLIQYDGTRYQGWQSQKSGITLQDAIERCVRLITGEEVRLTGAGRTDAGVHALGQVAAFSTGSELPVDVFKRALNAKLPRDIRILDMEEADGNFHPRFGALKKRYVYFICLGRIQSPFFCNYSWHIPAELDAVAMQKAASYLAGSHDFSSFRASGCSAKTAFRNLSLIKVEGLQELSFMDFRLQGTYLKITMEADAFLRHMVRNIVGTLVEAGRGRISPDDMPGILNAGDRTKAGPTAPAAGLFLAKVYY